MQRPIRAATVKDVPQIIALERQVPNAAHWSREQYESRLNAGCLLVAENGSKPVAFICARVLPGEWEIENVVVAESFQRQGIASALLHALFAATKKAGNPAFHLEVRESNSAARALYVKHGFHEVGKRPKYYLDPPEDAVLYSRSPST